MKVIVWTAEFETGCDEIDDQHRVLVRAINELILCSEENSKVSREAIHVSLDSLIEYAVIHFDTEEQMMKQSHYPDSDLHIRLHNNFKMKIVKYYKRFESGENMIPELVIFLEEWLRIHIQNEDRKLAQARD